MLAENAVLRSVTPISSAIETKRWRNNSSSTALVFIAECSWLGRRPLQAWWLRRRGYRWRHGFSRVRCWRRGCRAWRWLADADLHQETRGRVPAFSLPLFDDERFGSRVGANSPCRARRVGRWPLDGDGRVTGAADHPRLAAVGRSI